jgi:hypothetical protein
MKLHVPSFGCLPQTTSEWCPSAYNSRMIQKRGESVSDSERLRNKYRRAFSWSVSRGNAGKTHEAAGMVRLATSEYPDILEDYLSTSRKRKGNKLALSKLQLHMLEDIVVQEKSIKSYKDKLAAETNLPDRAEAFINSQITSHGLIANTIRQIGDGVAWRAFDYDRFTTRILCSHPVKQTILAEGTAAELGQWAAINDSANRRAIFNAVTNSITIGDVTAIHDNGDVELIEVKSGNAKSRRLIRQKQILRDAAGVLTSGSGVVEGKSVISGVLPMTPKNHLGGLRDLLAEAGTKGWSAALLAPHCYVECADFSSLRDMSELATKRKETLGGGEGWGDEMVITASSMDLIQFVPNAAPLTIFPLDDRTCIDLAIGAKAYTTYINLLQVLGVFYAAGWTVDHAGKDAMAATQNEASLMVRKEGFVCHLPPADIARLAYELLSPETLVEECELLRKMGPSIVERYGVWTCEGEAIQWN